MPDEVSNTGADWVTNDFGNDLKTLNDKAAELIPTGYITYPLKQEEERFPFISPQAKGFEPAGLNQAEPYTAGIEGVAYVERYVSALSGKEVKAVFTAGGVSNSEAWLTIISNVLNKPIYKIKHLSGAVGAAVLASKTYYSSIIEAVKYMVVMANRFFHN